MGLIRRQETRTKKQESTMPYFQCVYLLKIIIVFLYIYLHCSYYYYNTVPFFQLFFWSNYFRSCIVSFRSIFRIFILYVSEYFYPNFDSAHFSRALRGPNLSQESFLELRFFDFWTTQVFFL